MSWKYFTEDEMRCKCGCGVVRMKTSFMAKLDALREEAGIPLPVTSGFRCPMYNAQVSITGRDGPHTTGRAVDLNVDRERAFLVIALAAKHGFTGIGVEQRGSSRFLHLDDLEASTNRPRPTVWSY